MDGGRWSFLFGAWLIFRGCILYCQLPNRRIWSRAHMQMCWPGVLISLQPCSGNPMCAGDGGGGLAVLKCWKHSRFTERGLGGRMPTQVASCKHILEVSHMDVSENRGCVPPKSSILIGFSVINHPFWGSPIWETSILSNKSWPVWFKQNFHRYPQCFFPIQLHSPYPASFLFFCQTYIVFSVDHHMFFWVVVSNICYFHPENWGRWTHFDEHIFQRGWNHQLVLGCANEIVMLEHQHVSIQPSKHGFKIDSWGLALRSKPYRVLRNFRKKRRVGPGFRFVGGGDWWGGWLVVFLDCRWW